MYAPVLRRIPVSSQALHYGLMLAASAAWVSAVSQPLSPGQDWTTHRLLGLAALVLLALGWWDAARAHRFHNWIVRWREGLFALRSLLLGRGPADRRREEILNALIPLGLLAATVTVLAGLPSVIRLDAVLHPAAWVMQARHVHAYAGGALMVLWLADLTSLLFLGLQKLGRGQARPQDSVAKPGMR